MVSRTTADSIKLYLGRLILEVLCKSYTLSEGYVVADRYKMELKKLDIKKSFAPSYRRLKPNRDDIENFKKRISNYFSVIDGRVRIK